VFDSNNNGAKRDLDTAAGLMKEFPGMMSNVDSKAAKTTLGDKAPLANKNYEFNLDKEKQTEKKSSGGGWFSNVIRDIGNFLGDVIEHIKAGFQAVLRVVVKAIGPVLRFAIKIFDEVLSVAIDTLSGLLGTINSVLKQLTGIDLFALFGFGFDVEKIKQTQDVSGHQFHRYYSEQSITELEISTNCAS